MANERVHSTTQSVRCTRVFQPSGFYPQDLRPICRDSEAVRAIVHKVITGGANRKGLWAPFSFGDGVHLVGRRNWDRSRKSLTESLVFECDETYIRGVRSMRYRLLPPWNDAPIVQHELQDLDLAKRLTGLDDSGREQWESSHEFLEGWLRGLRVQEGPIRRLICRLDSPRQRRARLSVELIQAGDPRMKVSQFGRVYSAATGCPRRIRPWFSIGDELLIEQDVVSCQPYLFGLSVLGGESWIPSPCIQSHR
jgi:hypothetical protein